MPLRRVRVHRDAAAAPRRAAEARHESHSRYQRAGRRLRGGSRCSAPTPSAAFLGGGTNLVDLMKPGVERPALLVDVTRTAAGPIED